MMDDILKGMLRRGFNGKREIPTKEFKGNIRFSGRELSDKVVEISKKKGLIKTKRSGGLLELNFDLFK